MSETKNCWLAIVLVVLSLPIIVIGFVAGWTWNIYRDALSFGWNMASDVLSDALGQERVE